MYFNCKCIIMQKFRLLIIPLILFVVVILSGNASAYNYSYIYNCDSLNLWSYWSYYSGVDPYVSTYNGHSIIVVQRGDYLWSSITFNGNFNVTIYIDDMMHGSINIKGDKGANYGSSDLYIGKHIFNIKGYYDNKTVKFYMDNSNYLTQTYNTSQNYSVYFIVDTYSSQYHIYLSKVIIEADIIKNMPPPENYSININGSFVYNGVPFTPPDKCSVYYNGSYIMVNPLLGEFACNNNTFNYNFSIDRNFDMNFELDVPINNNTVKIIPFNITPISGLYNYTYNFGVIELGNAENYTLPSFPKVYEQNFVVSGYCYYNNVPMNNVTVWLEGGGAIAYTVSNGVGYYLLNTSQVSEYFWSNGVYMIYADDMLFTSPVYYINVVNNTTSYNVDIYLTMKNNSVGDIFNWYRMKKIEIRQLWYGTLHFDVLLSVGNLLLGVNVYLDQLNNYINDAGNYIVNNGINNYFSVFTSLLGNLLNVIPSKVYYVINLLIIMDIIMVVWRSV